MLKQYATSELERVDLEYDGMVKEAVLEIVDVFAGQGHSGGSAAITLGAVERLLRFQPLTPLTGEDDEWMEVDTDLWQSKRCPSVFKDKERAWDIDLPREVLFAVSGSEGDTERWATVTFPYMPGQANA